jgi:membrane protein
VAGRLARLKQRPWVAHLLRAGTRYTTRLGSQFAAAITYFSVLAVVPTLMFIFAVAGFVLTVARPELLLPLATAAADAVGAADRATRDKILATITNVLSHYTSIGIVGLLSAVYSGAGWMGNLKNAVRSQARPELDLQPAPANFLAKTAGNLATLLGLVVLIAVTFGLASVSTSLTGTILDAFGLTRIGWLAPLLHIVPIVFSIGAGWLLFRYLFILLPEEREDWPTLRRGSLLGAVGLAVLQYLATFLIGRFTSSPSAALFGPIIALMVFFNLFAQLILFVAAWIGTAKHEASEPADVAVRFALKPESDDASEPAMVSEAIAARGVQLGLGAGYVTGAATGVGLGAGLAYLLSAAVRGRRRD